MTTTNSPLGKGLAALLGDLDYTENLESPSDLKKIPINNIIPGSMQPRQTFDPEQMAQLIESIREKGVLQPILVRESSVEGTFEIIAGERRWRAAKDAALESVPAIIIECSDEEALEVG
ncbi:MAG: ParB/RepB/Spo0J family partition protein, partial [Alphaproteobacteria bacterium]|nr:ParB/RepB/Spo0J family partition protein [Alphaproteobacteria bacterium]